MMKPFLIFGGKSTIFRDSWYCSTYVVCNFVDGGRLHVGFA